jgi:hypothetical protein
MDATSAIGINTTEKNPILWWKTGYFFDDAELAPPGSANAT